MASAIKTSTGIWVSLEMLEEAFAAYDDILEKMIKKETSPPEKEFFCNQSECDNMMTIIGMLEDTEILYRNMLAKMMDDAGRLEYYRKPVSEKYFSVMEKMQKANKMLEKTIDAYTDILEEMRGQRNQKKTKSVQMDRTQKFGVFELR